MLKRNSAGSPDPRPGLSTSQQNHYLNTGPGAGPPGGQHSTASATAGSPEPQRKKLSVSNLTKTLLSSAGPKYAPQASPATQTQTATPGPSFSGQPPPYSSSAGGHSSFVPAGLLGSVHSRLASSPFTHGAQYGHTNPPMPLFTPPTGHMNYIPLGHNTPTVVSSSYTSSHSFTPSLPNGGFYPHDNLHQAQPQPVNAFSGSYRAPAGATTNISMDSANPHLSLHHRAPLNRHSISSASSNFGRQSSVNYVHSLPNSFVESSSLVGRSSLQSQTLHGMPSDGPVVPQQLLLGASGHVGQPQSYDSGPVPNTFNEQTGSFLTGPDHYMSYQEYLSKLNQTDVDNRDGDESGYEEHLNIVEYPVDELITMLACLLTKIIEANDKLHPNHFDNTIAARQKLKEHKKAKKIEREQKANKRSESTSFTHGGINTTVSQIAEDDNSDDSSDEEEDELKNKYLANVLAFHGTNVPGITLHAYLTRVLKYCPVTNEVFLSLLVYFDRIAKRANIFDSKKSMSGEESTGEAEQIFVMDSFNIHRLIILGITVSSKFFSDIFYKNLRYAKVGGLPLEELNYLELQFLLLLDFKLMISVEDLQNYGDLLLKFWKREQLAGEIVSKDIPATETRHQNPDSQG